MQYKPLSVEDITVKIRPVLEKYNIKKAALFGSCTRGEMRRGSDIDLLVDASGIVNGLVFVELKRKIENKLGRKVDLISYNSLDYSKMKDSILSEAQVIYEKRY